uniref:STAS domain-containing protein n=1 Tax=Salmonella enterica TaxID=28901 RepID=UPI003FD73FFF
RIVISGEMTIFSALDWRERLLAAIAQPGDLELDLSSVSEIDAAGIQLLVSLQLEAKAEGRQLRVVRAGERVVEAFTFCRLLDFLGEQTPAMA